MSNPYQTPEVIQTPPRAQDLFERLNKYLFRAFYSGLIIVILCTLISISLRESVLLKYLIALGGTLIALSLLSIIPLSIWGFILGYQSSRKKD